MVKIWRIDGRWDALRTFIVDVFCGENPFKVEIITFAASLWPECFHLESNFYLLFYPLESVLFNSLRTILAFHLQGDTVKVFSITNRARMQTS